MAKVLVVDDSMYSRIKVREILEKDGHEIVAEASNGNEAYDRYCEFLPDIVTMDIAMPKTDGLEAVKRILRSFPDASVIMLSAVDQKQLVFNALKIGAKNYIVKPVKEDHLLSAIKLVLTDKVGIKKS